MAEFHDALETRDPEAREAAQFARLRETLARALTAAPGLADHLAGVDPQALTDRGALARLPLLRKADLAERQRAAPSFGGLTTARTRHAFMSPGPVFEPGGDGHDWWRMARALHAAGIGPGDLIHNCFAYHLTPAGMMFESGARAVGASVFPGGTGQTEAQAQAAAHLRPTAWTGTPDFLKTILDKGAELGLDLSSITKALVSGGALFPSLREAYRERGVAVLQCYATADVGLIAYESRAGEPMVVDEGVIVEIVRPGTGDPVADGEVGEVVVTRLDADYPLTRLATGDLSAWAPGVSPCGRTGRRLRGWMGRADQTAKVRGMFVRPEQVAAVLRRHPECGKARLEITREGEADVFTLAVETEAISEGLVAAVAESVAAVMNLRGSVVLATPGSLPNDGRVIDDQRKYD